MSDSASPQDYYERLGVSRQATTEEMKKAFRKKAKQLHPDVNPSPDAENEFKALAEAFEVLSDPQKRQVYDTYGHDGLKSGGYSPHWSGQGFPDLQDIFASFFGADFGFAGGGGGRGRSGPPAGEDIRHDIYLSFEDAAFGRKETIKVPRMEACDACDSTGAESGAAPTACSTCGGNGQVRQTAQTFLGSFTQISTCPSCHGEGQQISNPCKACRGQGRVEKEHGMEINIPAGVDEGTRLRVGGEGNIGPRGGGKGSLYVFIHVEEHDTFHRDGVNVLSVFSVPYPTLVLGGDVQVPTLDGPVKLKIPAGTESGEVFPLRGHGVPHLNQIKHRGDHIVQVQVAIPKGPKGEERKLIEQLGKLHHDKTHAEPVATRAADEQPWWKTLIPNLDQEPMSGTPA